MSSADLLLNHQLNTHSTHTIHHSKQAQKATRSRIMMQASTPHQQVIAASSVLGIAELLEQILSELPPPDIFRCQRVSKTWYELITNSPLLQYKSWLRNDHSDPAQHVRANDLILDAEIEAEDYGSDYDAQYDAEVEHHDKCYRYNISRHLHPVFAACFMKYPSTYFEDSFLINPNENMKGEFWARLPMNSVILRALIDWYQKNKDSEHIWGHISLCRPSVSKVKWGLSNSDGSGSSTDLEARYTENMKPEGYSAYSPTVDKEPGTPLVLTVSDILKRLGDEWEAWLYVEHENHYFSHDGEGCNFSVGVPPESCLRGDNKNESESECEKLGDGVEGKENSGGKTNKSIRLRPGYKEESEEEKTRRTRYEMISRIEWAMEKSSEPHIYDLLYEDLFG